MESSEPIKQVETQDSQAETWTVLRILNWTTEHLKKHGFASARLESEVLLAHARKCQRIQLYTHYNEIVSDTVRATMRDLVKRRVKHEPVAYLVGHKEFFSLEFEVASGVFIPRPETETLVMRALKCLEGVANPQVLELCSGSGCISIAIASQLRTAMVTTIEKNPRPLEYTARNIERHQLSERVTLLEGDLFSPVAANTAFDLIVSNPPYVRSDEIPGLAPDIREHEPHAALDGGIDGLDVVRRILEEAPDYLRPGGWCLLEMDPTQIPECSRLASANPCWNNAESFADDAGLKRFLAVRKSVG